MHVIKFLVPFAICGCNILNVQPPQFHTETLKDGINLNKPLIESGAVAQGAIQSTTNFIANPDAVHLEPNTISIPVNIPISLSTVKDTLHIDPISVPITLTISPEALKIAPVITVQPGAFTINIMPGAVVLNVEPNVKASIWSKGLQQPDPAEPAKK